MPFEGPASITGWALNNKYSLSVIEAYQSETFPAIGVFDALIVLGGPMGVYDIDKHPWLVSEKAYIKSMIDADKPVLGICLGAQLIADVLGAEVSKNPQPEIGWFPVFPADGLTAKWEACFHKEQMVFHWHGDTFSLPSGAEHLLSSVACTNQAFSYGKNVLGLQCHFEMTYEGARSLTERCPDELVDAPYVQTCDEILRKDCFIATNLMMENILDIWIVNN